MTTSSPAPLQTPIAETFALFSERVIAQLEIRLQHHVALASDDTHLGATQLNQAMKYSLVSGGKRLRALLVVASYEAIAGHEAGQDIIDIAASVECIHAYSLIHDDLPAMDNDTLRRGKPTNHIQYGEATAILAGDALQTLAFEILCNLPIAATTQIALIGQLSHASGAKGMVGGQYFDLASENQTLTLQQLQALHNHKTGALIAASVALGAIAAGVDAANLERLKQFGKMTGLAFQVIDDILDIEGDTATLGKTQGADIAANKATFPAIMGLEPSKAYANKLVNSALDVLRALPLASSQLVQIAKFITSRAY